MPREYRRYEPDQTLLFPPSLRDWLPEEHLAFFLSDTIDALDLSAFDARYGEAGPGNQAFDPSMMLKVLVYAYATGTFSSRKIATKLYDDLKGNFACFYDQKGAVGRRYRRQDEAGTPYCMTIDGQTKEDNTITVRERDSMEQTRINIDQIKAYLREKLDL